MSDQVEVTIVETPIEVTVEGAAGPAGQGVPAGGTTGQSLTKIDGDDYNTEWSTPAGGGDMLASVYDPTSVVGDVFDMDNMVEGTNLILTAAERASIAAAGDVTAASSLGDNLLIRGDGATKGVQNTGISIDDSDNVSGIATLTLTDSLHLVDAAGIKDDSGNEQLIFNKTASAVNYLEVTNGATGDKPIIAGTGSDTDVGITFQTKGDGCFRFESHLDLVHTATETGHHGIEIDLDAAGFGDNKALDIVYITGAQQAGSVNAVILVDINQLDAVGGGVIGLEVLTTDGGADNIVAVKAGAVVAPIVQDAGVFVNPTTGTNNTVSTDVADMIDGSEGTNTTIFVNQNDYIIIGANDPITQIEFNIETGAPNPGIQPTVGYSTAGAHQFTNFTPTDGTNGFRNTGVMAWDADELTGHTINDDTGTFDYKITRAHAAAGSVSLFFAKTAETVVYSWNKEGVISANTLEPTGDTAAGDSAAMGYTASEGLILTGQGGTNDITAKNDADATVWRIPTGTTGVTFAGVITATNAALTTPALGTPSALVVTNATGSAAGIDSDATTHAASDGSSHSDVVANTAKNTNVPTALSVGTITATTFGITSDGGADDVVLPEADTDDAGLLGADKWDEIVANTLKTSNATHTGDVTGSVALTIAAKAVDVAMLADGTDGELITWGTSGVAETVAVGTANDVLTSNGVGVPPTFQAAAGGGDMVLADAQTVTGAKTFDSATLLLNDTDSAFDLELGSTSTITGANKTLIFDVNDGNRTLTVGADTTLSGGTHSGTNTGDQTSIVGITGTKAQFDTAVTDGNVQYVGDAPTAHTVASHSDTTATGAELETLTDGSNADALHTHAAGGGDVSATGTPLITEFARWTDGTTIEGRTPAEVRADLSLEVGTDVLAEQAIGIADDNLLEVDGTPATAEYARFTANGLEGRTESEFKADFNLEIGVDVQAEDAVLTDLAALTAVADNEFIVGTGAGVYAHESGSTARTSMGAVGLTGAETVAGVKTFSSDPLIPDEVYGAGWNASLEPPTKNAVFDKIETLGGGGDMVLADAQTVTGAKTFDAATLLLNDTDSAFDLELGSTSTITSANKTLIFDVNNANRTLTLGADVTLDQDVSNAASPVFAVTNMTGSAAGIDSAATTHAASDGSSHSDVVANTAKNTNVPTALSAGTVTATTYGITSDGGADDIVLPEATTSVAGLLGADKWDEIVASTAHAAADGSSHSFIDQSVISGATPTLTGTNFSGVPNSALTTVLEDLGALTAVADNEVIVGTGAGTYAHEAASTLPATIGGVIEDLDTLGAPSADGEFIVATAAGAFAYETGATARASMGVDAAGTINATLSKSVTIPDPVAADDATMFFTPVAITVTDVRSHITGATNVVFNINHASTRTGTGLDVFSSDITLTSTAGQSNNSGFDDETIPANSWVWVDIVSVSGTPTQFHATVIFTQD